MIVELHIIQNVVPANLNRDDTGAPKDCTFGGVPRARVSSQALKRAARRAFGEHGLGRDELGVRTRRVLVELTRRLADRGRPEEQARAVAESALASIGLKVDDNGNNEYLLYLGSGALDQFADRCDQLWDELAARRAPTKGKKPNQQVGGLTDTDLLNASRAVDVALFGRMIADLPDRNVDAACQVAHAISTHEVRTEFDYFTAVDDLLPDADTGAGMIGTVEFNSACLYRYSNVDTEQLVANLGGDRDLATRGLRAYLSAMTTTLPSGKQNSMAAHNPPSLVLAVRRRHGQWNLANAFADPVRPGPNRPLIQESVRRTLDYLAELTAAYPAQAPDAAGYLLVGVRDVEIPAGLTAFATLDSLIEEFGEV